MVRGDASLPDFDDLSDGQGVRIDCQVVVVKGLLLPLGWKVSYYIIATKLAVL